MSINQWLYWREEVSQPIIAPVHPLPLFHWCIMGTVVKVINKL